MNSVFTRRLRLLLAALPPLLILLALPLRPALVLRLGTEVTLAARPVDPRDLFRGDYLALSFEIEKVPAKLFPSGELTPVGSEWFVSLEERGGVWVPSRVTAAREDGPCLKGRVIVVSTSRESGETSAVMDYGTNMRRFYVREGTGEALEKAAAKSGLRARVRLWRGEAAIRSVSAVPDKS